MDSKFSSNIWKTYEKACNEYLRAFCDKHTLCFDDVKQSWVGLFTGTIVFIEEWNSFAYMEDIILDVELNADPNEYMSWYHYKYDEEEERPVNYSSWLLGMNKIINSENESSSSNNIVSQKD